MPWVTQPATSIELKFFSCLCQKGMQVNEALDILLNSLCQQFRVSSFAHLFLPCSSERPTLSPHPLPPSPLLSPEPGNLKVSASFCQVSVPITVLGSPLLAVLANSFSSDQTQLSVTFPKKHFLSVQVAMHTHLWAVVKSKVYLGLNPSSATRCDLGQIRESLFAHLQHSVKWEY